MDKGKLLVYGIIILVILCTGIYTVSVFSNKGDKKENVDFSIPEMVEKDQVKDDYNSRLKNANAYQEPEEKKNIAETINFDTYENSKGTREIETSTKRTNLNRYSGEYSQGNSNQQNEVKTSTKTIVPDTVKIENKLLVENKTTQDPGGFGIIMSEKQNNYHSNNNIVAKNGGFYPAMLEEDTEIKKGSSVVFFLLEDCTLDGTLFKKNSILYGKTTINDNTFEIHIFQIRDTNNKMYSLSSNVIVYDEKYSRGLAGEGKINEAFNESVNQTTDESSSSLAGSLSSNVAANGIGLAAKAVNNTIHSITKKKEPSITRYKGYTIFIKQE